MNLGEERIPPGEDEAIARVLQASEELLNRDASPVPRDQHPSHYGCLRAEFTVLDDLPENYRVGLFRTPQSYPGWIRFSNGGQVRDDRKPDAHGMAIKLMNVVGPKVLEDEADATTHDFVMVDNPIFFLRNAIDYGKFSTVLLKARAKRPSTLRSLFFFLPGKLRELAVMALLFFIPWRLSEFGKLLKFAAKRIKNPLTTRYWSTTPSRFGPGAAMKFSARPVTESKSENPEETNGFLRRVMVEQLANEDFEFEFLVQLQADPASMPIEDPTVLWDESESPYQVVARIKIPAQEFDTPERHDFAEHLSFTPWHAIEDHRPLGGINRVRKAVYTRLSTLRHQLNDKPRREPNP